MVLVTDLQFYMNKHLRSNLKEIPRFLKKGYDCVIIISGHGKVRIGKSTMAQQVGYYVAWLLAGGKKKPKKKVVPFNNSNVIFTPDQLKDLAQKLPKKSVIVYDEGRAGLDSIRAMENINKGMMDFFQECGQYQHVILIVLPNYFRLSEDMAVPRSLFLIDVYHDSKYNRGYFKFYNEIQKEYLYVWGKKKLGTYAKYGSANPSFSGMFTDTHPNVDVDTYDREKRTALVNKQKKTTVSSRAELKYNQLLYKLNSEGYSIRKLAYYSGGKKDDIAKRIRVGAAQVGESMKKREKGEISTEDEEELVEESKLITPRM